MIFFSLVFFLHIFIRHIFKKIKLLNLFTYFLFYFFTFIIIIVCVYSSYVFFYVIVFIFLLLFLLCLNHDPKNTINNIIFFFGIVFTMLSFTIRLLAKNFKLIFLFFFCYFINMRFRPPVLFQTSLKNFFLL